MTECREQRWLFQELGNRKVEVDFGGGYLSSDGGGLILREVERHSGLLRDFSECFIDYRNSRYIEHSVQELVSQRIHGLALGYEDLNDHDHLRLDPTEITANMSRRSLMLKIRNRHTRLTRQVISPIMPATPGEQKLRNGCSLGKDISGCCPRNLWVIINRKGDIR